MKVNDVYRATWKPSKVKKSDPHWCFDGQLIVSESLNGELYLYDTYWNNPDKRPYTPERALELFDLTFVCNLNDVKKFNMGDPRKYFKPEDVFDLSYQHGSYRRVRVRKDAKPDPGVMKEALLRNRERAEWEIEALQRELQRIDRDIEKIESGDIGGIFITDLT